MKGRKAIALGSLFATLGMAKASAQSEPIPGYYELQVAYCWGYYSAMIPANEQASNWACGPNFTPTATLNCQTVMRENVDWRDQTNALRDYLFTGTVDHGANSGVEIAIARGRKLAADITSPNSSLTPQEVKDKSTECTKVINDLPD